MTRGSALDGEYDEVELPLLLTRRGMAEWLGNHVRILDRRELPAAVHFIECRSVEDIAQAIERMAIQGAFTLALAAGYGMALAVATAGSDALARSALERAARRLGQTRPTGLALARMIASCRFAAAAAESRRGAMAEAIVDVVERQAALLARQALATARHALPLVAGADAILTHCFADRSLLYLLLETRRRSQRLHVYCSETRPYLQGARMTAPAVVEIGHRATVITDGMGGFIMRRKMVQAFVTAADRVCLDGSICNKVGTYQYALAARASGIPYYVLRQSGPDYESIDESDIEVEVRPSDAVLECFGRRTTSNGVEAFYPAFDISPPELVTAIVTDRGAFPPSLIQSYNERPETAAPMVRSGISARRDLA